MSLSVCEILTLNICTMDDFCKCVFICFSRNDWWPLVVQTCVSSALFFLVRFHFLFVVFFLFLFIALFFISGQGETVPLDVNVCMCNTHCVSVGMWIEIVHLKWFIMMPLSLMSSMRNTRTHYHINWNAARSFLRNQLCDWLCSFSENVHSAHQTFVHISFYVLFFVCLFLFISLWLNPKSRFLPLLRTTLFIFNSK